MYILECADGSYYTGSTTDLELRLQQHQSGEGANHTRKRLPVQLVYYEEFDRIDEAFYREKQVQGWSRRKKEALMENRANDLPLLSKNYTDKDWYIVPSTGSGTESSNKYNTGDWAESKSQGVWVRMCLRQAQAPRVVLNIIRWLSGAEITEMMSENVPSTSSGTESNTVIERSRNHRDKDWKMCLRELRSQTFSLCSGIGSSNNKSFLQMLENLLFLS